MMARAKESIRDTPRRIGRVLLGMAILLAAAAAAPCTYAQDFPTRTVKIIVPFPPGGSADIVPRLVGEWLARKWKQPVVIENRPGAAGNIGAELAYRAEPDGHTLLAAPPPPLVVNQSLYPRLNFDPARFEKIIVLARIPNALVVGPTFPASAVGDLIAYAKSNPGKINAAIAGNGTTSHLTSEMFQMMASVKFQHVPYTGSVPALNDLMTGRVDIMFDNLGISLGLVKSAKLRLLAVASASRMASLPDVPTIAETLPGFASEAFYAVVAPPRTPQWIVEKINADVDEALRQPDLAKRLAPLSAETVGGTPKETSDYLQREAERWGKIIKAANVKLE